MAETPEHKIILLSMVQNETRIIERLMNSVKGKVDAIVICDTGSTDDTV
jgi:glycosyltransferase involved in cell wall biosynthesis